MPFRIVQWNARSLSANGQEFKKMIRDLINLPDVICVQETTTAVGLCHSRVCIRKDRTQTAGGGCAIFVKKGVAYRNHECIKVEVWTSLGKLIILNYYNPCGQLSLLELSKILSKEGIVIWGGDFNAHSVTWGSSNTDKNGTVVEFIEDIFFSLFKLWEWNKVQYKGSIKII